MLIRTADFDDGQRKKQNPQRILYYDGKQRFCWRLPAKDRLFTGNGGVWRGNLKLKRGKKCVPSHLISFISQFSYFALHLYEVNFEKVMKKKKNKRTNKQTKNNNHALNPLMFAGINMLWARLRLILARTTGRARLNWALRRAQNIFMRTFSILARKMRHNARQSDND